VPVSQHDKLAADVPSGPAILLRFLPYAAAATIAGICLAALYCRIRLLGSYSSDTGGFERNVLYGIQQLLRGKALYTDPSSPPYAVVQYMPLYYYVVAAVATALRLDPTRDVHQLLMVGRTLSLIFNLASVALVWRCLRQFFTVSRVAAGLGCAYLFLLQGGALVGTRPDALKDALVCAFIYCALLYCKSSRLLHLRAAALLAVVAALAKVNAAVCGPLLLLALAIERDWRGLRSAIVAGGGGAAGGAALGLALLGWAWPANTIKGGNSGISLGWFYEWVVKRYMLISDGLIVAGLTVALLLLVQRRTRAEAFLGLAVFLLFATSTISGLRWGGGGSYFAEFHIVSVMAIVAYVCSRIDLGEDQALRVAASMLASTLLIASTFMKNESLLRGELKRRAEHQEQREHYALARQAADRVLAQGMAPGHWILSNDDYIDAFLQPYCLLPQKEVVALPGESMSNKYGTFPRHVFDYSSFGPLVASGRLDWVIFSPDWHLPTHYITADFSGYTVDFTLAGFEFYKAPVTLPER
jgi:hypothetical protein